MKTLLLLTLVLGVPLSAVFQTTPFQFTHAGSVIHVRFSPSGSKLVSYSSGNQDMCLWDVQTGRVLWKRPVSFIQKADEYFTLDALAWSPDEKFIATGSANGTIQLWNSETGEFLWSADIAKSGVSAIAFSPDGKSLAAVPFSDESASAKLLDVASGRPIKTYLGDKCEHIAAFITQNGTELRIGDLHSGVSRWSLMSGDMRAGSDAKCRSQYSYGGDRSYSPDLSLSVRRTEADRVVIEETAGKTIKELKFNDSKLSSTINAKAKLAVIRESGDFQIYDLATGAERSLDDCLSGSALDVSSDGKMFAQSCEGFKTMIKLTNLATGKVSLLDGHPSKVQSLAFSPNYSLLAVAGNDGNAYLFDPSSKNLIKTFAGDGNRLTAVAFRPNGDSLLTGDENGTLHEWNVKSGKRIRDVKLQDRSDDIRQIEISKDNKTVTVQINEELILMTADLSPIRYLSTLEGYTLTSGGMSIKYSSVPILGAGFVTNGSTMVTGHSDGSIRIWDSTTGHQIRKLTVNDQMLLISTIPGRQEVIVLIKEQHQARFLVVSLLSGRVLRRSRQFDGSYAEKISASSNGRYAVATDISGDAFIVDLHSMAVRELNRQSGSDSVAFSKNSDSFFVGGANQNLQLYDTISLKKLWQLLPDFQPSPSELRLDEERRRRNTILVDAKAKRDKQAAIDVAKYSKLIETTFLHFGSMSDPGEKRTVESDKISESIQVKPRSAANTAWFRLTNGSPLPVEVPTESMYFPDPKCFHQFSNGEKLFGSCGEREVSIWFGVKDKHGKWVPYGFDFGSAINLLPGSSVLFPVPLSLLEKGYSIVFECSFQNERASESDHDWDYGKKVDISIDKKQLPK